MHANVGRQGLSVALLIVASLAGSLSHTYGQGSKSPAGGAAKSDSALTKEREIDVVPSQLQLGDNLKAMVSEHLGGDPAEWTHFRVSLDRASIRFDTRTDEQLIEAISKAKTPTLREQAVYEYADRRRKGVVAVLDRAYEAEADPRVRIDTLWAVFKFGGVESAATIKKGLEDFEYRSPRVGLHFP